MSSLSMSMRVGARDLGQVGRLGGHLAEGEGSTDPALVAEETGRLRATGHEEIRQAVVIAIEDGHAAAGEELELAVVAVLDAGAGGLLHEGRDLGLDLGWLGGQ